MAFEAVIINPEHGEFYHGKGATATQAVMIAFRKEMQSKIDRECSASQKEELDVNKINNDIILRNFLTASTSDTLFESPATLKEDIHETRVLVRLDRTAESVYQPVGYVLQTML